MCARVCVRGSAPFCIVRVSVCVCFPDPFLLAVASPTSHTHTRALAQLQDNFRLEIGEEDAEYFFLDMIEQSVTAFFPVMAELIHAIAVSMRR